MRALRAFYSFLACRILFNKDYNYGKKEKKRCYCGIGGQAVLEGVMMKNQDSYAVAVRRPDGEIELKKEDYKGIWGDKKITKIPFLRGVFNFIDSLVLGMSTRPGRRSFLKKTSRRRI